MKLAPSLTLLTASSTTGITSTLTYTKGTSWIAIGWNPMVGAMVGTPSKQANGILCDAGGAKGILITSSSKAGVKTADAGAVTGVTGIKCTQSGGKTILTFTRPFNNGVANYAQISTTSTTATMFAAGNVPTFAAETGRPAIMSSVAIKYK